MASTGDAVKGGVKGAARSAVSTITQSSGVFNAMGRPQVDCDGYSVTVVTIFFCLDVHMTKVTGGSKIGACFKQGKLIVVLSRFKGDKAFT